MGTDIPTEKSREISPSDYKTVAKIFSLLQQAEGFGRRQAEFTGRAGGLAEALGIPPGEFRVEWDKNRIVWLERSEPTPPPGEEPGSNKPEE
jgi:hypothetical protein